MCSYRNPLSSVFEMRSLALNPNLEAVDDEEKTEEDEPQRVGGIIDDENYVVFYGRYGREIMLRLLRYFIYICSYCISSCG